MREYLMPDYGFNLVATEMGICFSSTYLYLLQNASELWVYSFEIRIMNFYKNSSSFQVIARFLRSQ